MHDFTCDPATEISGQTMIAYTDNVRTDVIEPIFEKYNLLPIDVNQWYPLQPLLDALKDLHEGSDGESALIAIGIQIAKYGLEPEQMNQADLDVVLEHWEAHMYTNVRNGDVGQIITEKVGENSYRLIQKNKFPDALCYGLAFGFARSRLPVDADFTVEYEEYDNRIDNGDNDETVILVSWE